MTSDGGAGAAALARRARSVRGDGRRVRRKPRKTRRSACCSRTASRSSRRAIATASRPWRLDLFPLLIDPAEWSAIERGVMQRARLVERAARRSVRRAARAQSRDAAAGPRVRQSAVLAAVHECSGARQSASALRRVRSRALGRRPLVGAQRPHAGALRSGLRAREPRRVLAVPAGAVRRHATCAGSRASFVRSASSS